jgi:hypothetical protein
VKKPLLSVVVAILQTAATIGLYRFGLISYLFPIPLIAASIAYFLILKNSPSLKHIAFAVSTSIAITLFVFYLAMVYCLNVYGS